MQGENNDFDTNYFPNKGKVLVLVNKFKQTKSFVHTPIKCYKDTMFYKKNKYYKNNYSLEAKEIKTMLPSQILLSKIIRKEGVTAFSANSSMKNSCSRARVCSRYLTKDDHCYKLQQLIIRNKRKTKPITIQMQALNSKLMKLKRIFNTNFNSSAKL